MFIANSRLAAFGGLASGAAQVLAPATPSADLWIWVAAAAMFVLVSLVIFHSLRNAKFLKGGGRAIVSVLVALLGVIGLFHGVGGRAPESLGHDSKTEIKSTISGLLIPYTALALTILAILILILLKKALKGGRRICAILRPWCQRLGRLKTSRHGLARHRSASRDDMGPGIAESAHCRNSPGNDA